MAYKEIRHIRTLLQKNEKPTGSILFFHGSGDTGDGAKEWIKFLLKKDISFPHLRVLFPTAPLVPYRMKNGELSNVWFDRFDISPDVPEHKESLDSIEREVKKLVDLEIKQGIPLNRIVIGGFSMGGALALHTAYRFCPGVAGVFTLSGFLNENSYVYDNIKKKNDLIKCPLFMCHGDRDDLVDIKWAKNTFSTLQSLGIDGQFHILKNTLHEMKKNEIENLIDWIYQVVPIVDNTK